MKNNNTDKKKVLTGVQERMRDAIGSVTVTIKADITGSNKQVIGDVSSILLKVLIYELRDLEMSLLKELDRMSEVSEMVTIGKDENVK